MKKKIIRVNAIAIAEMLKAAQEGIYTAYELVEKTGLTINTVRGYMNVFHKAGIVHVCDWEEDSRGNRTRKVYKLGAGKDMKKPRLSQSDVNRRYREKMKKLKQMESFNATTLVFRNASKNRIDKTMGANQSSFERRA
jgi:predicted ArsR family transcriptional regulator